MKKRYSGPQIVAKLRQADVLIGKGKPEVPKGIGNKFFHSCPLTTPFALV